MKEFLSHHNVDYEVRDIRQNDAYLQELVDLGAQSTPAVVFGDKVVIGFDPEKLEKMLDL